jgi:protein SCO1/2
VVLTLNYSDCPMLCSLQLNGLTTALSQLDRELGRDFDVVTISLDPNETADRARETARRYREDYTSERPGAREEQGAAWHFLRGTRGNVGAIADALGVVYAYNEVRKEYVHPAVLVVSTPDGRIARYLYGVEYHPKTLSLSLVEAANGKIGSSVDRLILYCFHYDETEGRYAPVAMNIMRVGGGLTAVALGTFLGAFWLRKERRRGPGASVVSSRTTHSADSRS